MKGMMAQPKRDEASLGVSAGFRVVITHLF